MMQDEFDEFVVQSGWLNDGLAAREIPLIFNLSMLVRVDELNKSQHLEASVIEFMEMIARCAHESSFPPQLPPGEDGMPQESTMTLQ